MAKSVFPGYLGEFWISDFHNMIKKAKNEGRNEIRYQVFNNVGYWKIQAITVKQAESILAYLLERPDVRFQGTYEGLPVFKHVLESISWSVEWSELEG